MGKKKHKYDADEEYTDDPLFRACSKLPCIKKPEVAAIVLLMVSVLFLLISTFLPYWRVDNVGTKDLDTYWFFSGFAARTYGILQVKGVYSQSWNTFVMTICQFRDLGGLSATVRTGWVAAHGNSTCGEGSSMCNTGFFTHMSVRCEEYQKMYRVSMAVLGFTFSNIILGIIASMAALLCKKQQSGGIVFGIFFYIALSSFVCNIAWCMVTDGSFKKLARTAWYPYPSLGFAWYLHFLACLIMAGSVAYFGKLVLPGVYAFDPVQAKIEKQREKMDRRNRAREKQRLMQAMNFPPPPGFGGQVWGPAPYEQQGMQPYMMGNGNACGGDFGLGGPPMHSGQVAVHACAPSPWLEQQGGQPASGDFGLGGPPQAGFGVSAVPQGHGPGGDYGMPPLPSHTGQTGFVGSGGSGDPSGDPQFGGGAYGGVQPPPGPSGGGDTYGGMPSPLELPRADTYNAMPTPGGPSDAGSKSGMPPPSGGGYSSLPEPVERPRVDSYAAMPTPGGMADAPPFSGMPPPPGGGGDGAYGSMPPPPGGGDASFGSMPFPYGSPGAGGDASYSSMRPSVGHPGGGGGGEFGGMPPPAGSPSAGEAGYGMPSSGPPMGAAISNGMPAPPGGGGVGF